MILMNDFKAEPSEMREAMLSACKRVIESGWFVLGNEVTTFEEKWAEICNVEHAVGVGNGMDAIEIALRALNIGTGDEVITTPMTAFPTVLAILRAGAIPVLSDIDSDTALLSLDSAKLCITSKTKAIVLVHLYGQIRQMNDWVSLCEQHGIELIEDCAQSHLASWRGNVAGSFGRAGAYSFYPTKNLGAVGDAGMLVTQDNDLAERAGRLRNYGQSVRYHHPELGMNSRLDEIHAAMLMVRLKWLTEFTTRRQQIAKSYQLNIENPLIQLLILPEEPSAHVFHLFVITCKHRDELQLYLKTNNIQSLIHYPIPIHQQESCLKISRSPNGLGNSELHAATCLSLPCHPQMSDSDVKNVIDVMNSFKVT